MNNEELQRLADAEAKADEVSDRMEVLRVKAFELEELAQDIIRLTQEDYV